MPGPRHLVDAPNERRKAQARAIVEHPFHVIKNLFGYRKVSYRGVAKNEVRAKAQAALDTCTPPGADCWLAASVCVRSMTESEKGADGRKAERTPVAPHP